ncbi:MAG: outer membrane lipoprotein carrier protein LolA [Candidatus Acidiferrales bacterium]
MLFFAFVVAVVALPPGPVADAKSAVRALESRYQHARTLKATFFERYSDGKGAVQSESGTVYFSRPGRMRWDYESPEEKLFLVDGTNVWFYVPADRTVSRAKMKDSSDWRTPIALLVGKADLSRLCRSIAIITAASIAAGKMEDRPVQDRDTVLRCTPRNSSAESRDATDALREVLLEIDSQARLVRVVLHEAGNIKTQFRFGNWEENIPIPEAQFHFQPAPGVTVVDEATLVGAIH